MSDYDYCKKHDTSFLMPELLMCPQCAVEALRKGAVPEPLGDALVEAIRVLEVGRNEAADEYQAIHEQVVEKCYTALEAIGVAEQPDGGGQPDYILPAIVEATLLRMSDEIGELLELLREAKSLLPVLAADGGGTIQVSESWSRARMGAVHARISTVLAKHAKGATEGPRATT